MVEPPPQSNGRRRPVPTIRISNTWGVHVSGADAGSAPLVQFDGPGEVTIEDSVSEGRYIRKRREERKFGRGSAFTVVSDVDEGTYVTGFDRLPPPSAGGERKKDEEMCALVSLVQEWNWLHNAELDIRHEPNDPPDGYLTDDGRDAIPVEVTELDGELRREFGTAGYVDRWFLTDIERAIVGAGTKKALPGRETWLLALRCPVGIGSEMRAQLEGKMFDTFGYREVWICPDGEGAFPLRPTKPSRTR